MCTFIAVEGHEIAYVAPPTKILKRRKASQDATEDSDLRRWITSGKSSDQIELLRSERQKQLFKDMKSCKFILI